MATRVEIEEITTTKSEKLLAVVLTAFVLVGAFWAYEKIDDAVVRQVRPENVLATPAEQAAIEQDSEARTRLSAAVAGRLRARDELEFKREAYRTALDAGQPAAQLERRYVRAQAKLEGAETELTEARAAKSATAPAAREAQSRINQAQVVREDRREFLAFVLRSLLAISMLGAGLLWLSRLRRRGSRYLPIAFALVGAGAILVLATATDYATNYIDPLDLGPLVLSLAGIAMTIAAFWGVQRYLARRIPIRRVRKNECPFCGYPAGAGSHCEGCGRETVAACATCGDSRRVGTFHCAACGHA
jgi:hypothetical protein